MKHLFTLCACLVAVLPVRAAETEGGMLQNIPARMENFVRKQIASLMESELGFPPTPAQVEKRMRSHKRYVWLLNTSGEVQEGYAYIRFLRDLVVEVNNRMGNVEDRPLTARQIASIDVFAEVKIVQNTATLFHGRKCQPDVTLAKWR